MIIKYNIIIIIIIILVGRSKDSNKCIQVSNEEVSEMFSLQSTLEEADDQIIMHI